jgi:hypothetical protein
MNIEGYPRRQEQVGRWKVNIVSYKVGDQYYCTVNNVEPGATLAARPGLQTGRSREKGSRQSQGARGQDPGRGIDQVCFSRAEA